MLGTQIGSKACWPLMGKTAAETIAVMMAVLGRLTSPMRGSVTFDNDTTFARHSLLRGMLTATTYFCDAYASWQKGGVENANGRIRRWLPRTTDLDAMTEADIQEIAMTLNLTPRKCLGFKSPAETLSLICQFLEEPAFARDFENVEYAEPEFDAQLATPGLHTVKRRVAFTPRRTILPPDLFAKYTALSFWRDPAGSTAFRITVQSEPSTETSPPAEGVSGRNA